MKSSAFLFSEVSQSALANSDEGFPFRIPKDNSQRFPGLLLTQVSISIPTTGERGGAVFSSSSAERLCCE